MKAAGMWIAAGLALAGGMVASGCSGKASQPIGTSMQRSQDAKSYPIKGKVVSTDAKSGEVTLDHEAIPGFMGAMTMPYKLKDPSVISELHPGDRLTAVLVVSGYEGVLDQIVITAQAKPDYKPKAQFHVPEAGDVVPDFKLTNQDGRQIHMEQFRGKVLLVTFIYTRCPLSDYCPRMSRNFEQVDQMLNREPGLKDKTHLLSVSFDPKYDTPKVLKSYGGGITGLYTHETFEHWDFAVPSEKDLAEVTQYFDVGVTAGDEKSLTHSLSTIVIGRDGRVVKWYPTNDWTPSDLLQDAKTAVAKG